MTRNAEWFVIASGKHEGRWHLAGWSLTAIKTLPTGPGDDGWLSLGVCPRCHVLVISDDAAPHRDNTWAHEQWHALTDYPIPDGLPRP